jgi:outer membrane protein OmpA-like peptidoglycan-associated protein
MKYLLACLVFLIGFNSYSHRPELAPLILHGSVLDMKTHVPVSADIDVYRNSDVIKEYSAKTRDGDFAVPLADFGWYIISISAPGYLEAIDTLWVINEKRRNVEKKFYVAPVEVGLTVSIKNIYFNFGKTDLTDQSFHELDKVATFFKANPGFAFEIDGHTDSDGPEDYNLILSQGRASAVVNYLVSRGVGRSQLAAHGYGESKPIDKSETKAAKARNRRVEFTVLKTLGQEPK